MPISHTLPKQERIRLNREVDALRACSQGFIAYPFRVVCLAVPSQEVPVKLLVTVGKKRAKRANTRNTIKRYLREAYRCHKQQLWERMPTPPTATLLLHFMFIGEASQASASQVEQAVIKAFERIPTLPLSPNPFVACAP